MARTNEPNATQNNIEALIADTADPAARAILLVLSNINQALNKNTEATQTIIEEFHEHKRHVNNHIVAEQKLISRAHGAWWMGVIMGAAVLSMGSFIIVKQMNTIETTAGELRNAAGHILLLESKVTDLERRQLIDEQRGGGK